MHVTSSDKGFASGALLSSGGSSRELLTRAKEGETRQVTPGGVPLRLGGKYCAAQRSIQSVQPYT